jgi:hypothetical protein
VHDDPPRPAGHGGGNASVEVKLTYVVDSENKDEQIVAHCNGKYGILKLTDLPQSICTANRDVLPRELDVLFVVQTTYSSAGIENKDDDLKCPTEPDTGEAYYNAGWVSQ